MNAILRTDGLALSLDILTPDSLLVIEYIRNSLTQKSFVHLLLERNKWNEIFQLS